MKKYVVLEKPLGQTPLAAIQKWKGENPEYTDTPASYAGRLDPMASGKLLVLLGEECKKQKRYTRLDKEYEVEVVLDIGSDTGDALGLVTYSGQETKVDTKVLARILRAEHGTHERAYPIFSSKTVVGIPLFLHTLRGTIHDIAIPTHPETIYGIRLSGMHTITTNDLRTRIHTFLGKVPMSTEPSKELGADFRVHEVRTQWEKLYKAAGERTFTILSITVTAGSGAYMRSLAGRLGEALGTKGLALAIHRTKIGKYRFGMWWKRFG